MRLVVAVTVAVIAAGVVARAAPADEVIRPVGRVWTDSSPPALDGPRIPRHEGLAVDAPTRDDVLLATSGGLLTSHDAGRHWRLVSERRLQSLDFLSPQVGFALDACGCADRLLGTRDGGRTWIVVRRFPAFAGYDSGTAGIDFADERHGWLWRNRLYHTGDGGLSWDVLRFRCPRRWWFGGVTFEDERHGYATCSAPYQSGTEDVRVYESADAGLRWRRLPLRADKWADARMGEHARPRDLELMKQTGTWGFGIWTTTTWSTRRRGYTLSSSVLTRTSDGGATWAQIRPRPAPANGGFAFLNARRGVWVDRDRILATDDGGSTWWPRARRPKSVWDVRKIPSGGLVGWGGVQRGPRRFLGSRFSRSFDGGRTWEQRGFLPSIQVMSVSIPARGRWFAVGYHGQLFRSGDAGRTWLPIGGRMRLGFAQFFTPRIGYGVTEHPFGWRHPARLMRTTDGGDHWTEVRVDLGPERKPILTNLAFADSRHGWISTAYGMLRTSDGGRTWTLFDGFGASEDESMAFATPRVGFVYGQSVLWRTRDGGRHWRFVSGPVDENARL